MTYKTPPLGWYTFGEHACQDIDLEFSTELDDEGFPHWERPKSE